MVATVAFRTFLHGLGGGTKWVQFGYMHKNDCFSGTKHWIALILH